MLRALNQFLSRTLSLSVWVSQIWHGNSLEFRNSCCLILFGRRHGLFPVQLCFSHVFGFGFSLTASVAASASVPRRDVESAARKQWAGHRARTRARRAQTVWMAVTTSGMATTTVAFALLCMCGWKDKVKQKAKAEEITTSATHTHTHVVRTNERVL